MSVEECLAHKWLAEESPERPLALEAASTTEAEAVDVLESEAEEKSLVSSTTSSDSMEEDNEEELVAPAENAHCGVAQDEIKPAVHELDVDEEEENQSSIQSFSDDLSEECASNSDKENSLVFNTVHNKSNSSNNISISSCSSSNSSHSSTEVLFPDAPTTPKVLRKAPSETPPSVKALVKKFQVDSVKKQQMSNATAEATVTSPCISSPSSVHNTSTSSNSQSACFVSQIPKLVHSPKSSSSYATMTRYSPSRTTGSPAKASLARLSSISSSSSKGLMSLDAGSNCERKEATPVPGSPLKSGGIKTETSSPLKSPSSRFAQAAQHMACVICGEFACRHQTTVSPRKPILGMEQRITC